MFLPFRPVFRDPDYGPLCGRHDEHASVQSPAVPKLHLLEPGPPRMSRMRVDAQFAPWIPSYSDTGMTLRLWISLRFMPCYHSLIPASTAIHHVHGLHLQETASHIMSLRTTLNFIHGGKLLLCPPWLFSSEFCDSSHCLDGFRCSGKWFSPCCESRHRFVIIIQSVEMIGASPHIPLTTNPHQLVLDATQPHNPIPVHYHALLSERYTVHHTTESVPTVAQLIIPSLESR
ncbi:hypothetical protein V8F20_012522 [Naviculisporaceae sp. PSN 640]